MSSTTTACLAACLSLAVVADGCGTGSRQGGGSWQAQRETRGDTLVVRTVSGSVWGDSARLNDELKIGELNGRPEYEFGGIIAMAVDAQGGIYVFDYPSTELRYYSADGTYVRTVGREGQGPGEYGNQVLGLAVRTTDGRLVAYDIRNQRLNVYGPDGAAADEWRVGSGLYTLDAIAVDTAGQVYIKITTGPIERNKPWPIGLLHLDAKGTVVDTIVPPHLADEPTDAGGTFLPAKVWAMSPLGYLVVGVSRTLSFELIEGGDRVVRIERPVPSVPVLPEEKKQWEATNEARRQRSAGTSTADIPPIPDTKAAYRALQVGQDGRIWVHRYVRAEKVPVEGGPSADAPSFRWSEPAVYDVFEPDGAFLGEVRVPQRTRLMVMRGDLVWGVRTGEYNEPYIVRMRVEHLGGRGGRDR